MKTSPPPKRRHSPLKVLLMGAGILVLLGIVGVAGLIGLVEFTGRYTQRQLEATVAQLRPGTEFSTVLERFGQPSRTMANANEILEWTKAVGARTEPEIAAKSVLYAFMHKGPPFRYLLVYTDPGSQKVIHGDWCGM